MHCDFALQVWNCFKQGLFVHLSMSKSVGTLCINGGGRQVGWEGGSLSKLSLRAWFGGYGKKEIEEFSKIKRKKKCEGGYWLNLIWDQLLGIDEERIFHLFFDWHDKELGDLHFHPIQREIVVVGNWTPPLGGKVKINFDGVSFGNPGLTRYGCVMRYSQGIIIIAKGGPIGVGDSNKAETVGLLESLRIFKSAGYKDCTIEGDSKTAISWGERRYVWLMEAVSLHSRD